MATGVVHKVYENDDDTHLPFLAPVKATLPGKSPDPSSRA